jgi:hypothetical protein
MSSNLSVEPPTRTAPPSFGLTSPFSESPLQSKKSPVEEMDASENIRGHAQWEKHMKNVNLQRRYQKVSVIMIHWEEDGESKDAVNAQQEVCKLWLLMFSTLLTLLG